MDFPVELYRPIIGYIGHRATLLSLLLTSRQLNAEAERSLYFKFEHVHNVQTQVLFLQRVVDCPRVARLVHSYRFEIDWRTNFGAEHIFWVLLPQALRAFVNLRTLQFRTNGGTPIKGLLDGCTFQLEHCYWHCHSDEPQMRTFLRTQRSLKSLGLGGWNATLFPAPPDQSEQPDFREVAGCYGVLNAFLPGRRITHARWVPDLDDPWDVSTGLDVVGLASSFQKLKYLKLGGYFMRPHLCSISEHLTSLVFLELMGYDEMEDVSVFALPLLKVLRISIRWGLSKMSIADPSARTEEIFTGSKSLQFIELEEESTYSDRNKTQQYSRWERGVGLVNHCTTPEMWPDVC
ncbi:hypothetical protein J3R30DRAFT_3699477 [Lentinula aciculospora]|uniref:F-box domain-containing protein n=1 Tax=Lentinula aciculospora TaxID=153920 RepID=A0A9W9AI47_9AGAR|nr:hypothetical protein J3R30DRAFT_3699477 [Lentinula aciculospora]